MMDNIIITIDGESGSGKTTLAKGLAKELGFCYLDTGAMYRAVTLKAISADIPFDEEEALTSLAANISIELIPQDDSLKILLDGKDVSQRIRASDVSQAVSLVSRIKGVREHMVQLQRKLSLQKSVVVEGRDIGTVVFPEAQIKLFLLAHLDERAKRRYEENKNAQGFTSVQDAMTNIKTRDTIDSTRSISPLKKPDNAVVIDTSNNTMPDTLHAALKIVKERL